MKKQLSLLLALLLTVGSVSMLASCSESTDNSDQGETSAAQNAASDVEVPAEEETEFVDPFAGTDFDGRSFRVYSSVDESDATNGDKFIHGSDELNGEAVNDAVFNRNQTVSGLLNIAFEFTDAEWTYSNADAQIKILVQAGSDDWDVMANDIRTLANLSRDGYIHNIYNSSILDLTQSYWYGDAMRDTQFIEGGMYLLLGDYFTDTLQSTHCLYANEQLLNNVYGSGEYINDLVFSGKWTFDAMIQVMADTAQDTDGSGAMNEGDIYGFTCIGMWGSMIPFLIGTDIQFIERTDNGPQFCFNNERSVKVLEKLNDLFYAQGPLGDTALTNPADFSTRGLQIIFENGQTTLVGYNRLGDLANFRDVEFSMGVVPYPKLDEDQAEYVSSIHDVTEVGAIPSTLPVDSLDFCHTVLEVVCRETGRMVIPEWYENGLKIKYSDGQDDAKMIDLIHDTITGPFPLAYDNALSGFMLSTCFSSPLGSNSTDFSSAYQKSEKAATKSLEKTYNKFAENLENGN